MHYPEREDRSPELEIREPRPSSERHQIPGRDRSYRLSDDEVRTLRTVGSFRTVNVKDLPQDQTRHLISSGLMEKSSVTRSNWSRMDVVVLSRAGERLLTDRQPVGEAQRFHSGLVKVREVEHDAAIYPAYREAAKAIESAGGTVDRVVLDYELKSVINSEMNRGGSVSGDTQDERRARLADELDLEIVDGKLPLPDLRIEYTDADGGRHHEDIEIVSGHYRGSHLAGKSAAGFKLVHKDGLRTAVPNQRRKGF